MRIGDEKLVDPVILAHRRRLLAATAAPLRAIVGERLALDVARVRERDDHVLARDQVLGHQVLRAAHDLRATRVAELALQLEQFVGDDVRDALGPRQNVEQVGDSLHHLAVLVDDLVLLESREAL